MKSTRSLFLFQDYKKQDQKKVGFRVAEETKKETYEEVVKIDGGTVDK
jgi:hypothetical protein